MMATKSKKPAAKTTKKAVKPKVSAKKVAPKKAVAKKAAPKAAPQVQAPVAANAAPAAAPMACGACDCSSKKCGKCGKVVLVILAVVAAIALACYVVCPKFKQAAAPALVGTQWGLVELSGKHPAEEGRFSLQFDAEGQMTGQSGCNRFSGRYEMDGEKLKVLSPLVGTRMACPGAAMKQENEFLDILSSAEQVGVQDDGRLFVWGAKGRILIFAQPQTEQE